MKRTIVITFRILIVILVISLISQYAFYTKVDGQFIRNTPVPTMTPPYMTVIGIVTDKPIHHGNASGVDLRIRIESVDFSPIQLVGKEVIVLLDASAMQLKKGDTVTLFNCQLNFGMTKLEYCSYKQILE